MMYEIGQEGEDMHYLEAGKYTIWQEKSTLYTMKPL